MKLDVVKVCAGLIIILALLMCQGMATETTWRFSGFELYGYDINFTSHNATNVKNLDAENITSEKINSVVYANQYPTLQDAINNLTVGRTSYETVIINSDYLSIGSEISVPSYTILDFNNAKLKLSNSANVYMINISNAHHVKINGGYFDGNVQNQGSNKRTMYVNNSYAIDFIDNTFINSGNSIYLDNAPIQSSISVLNFRSDYAEGYPLYLTNSDNILLNTISIDDAVGGIAFITVSNISVSNIRANNISTRAGITGEQVFDIFSSSNIAISNVNTNEVREICYIHGSSHGIQINNLVDYSNYSDMMYRFRIDESTYEQSDISLSNMILWSDGHGSNEAIRVYNSKAIQIHDVEIIKSGGTSIRYWNTSNSSVHNCILRDPGIGSGGYAVMHIGILIDEYCNNNTISDNIMIRETIDTVTNFDMQYGIYLHANSSNNRVHDNFIYNPHFDYIYDDGTNNIKRNNANINPYDFGNNATAPTPYGSGDEYYNTTDNIKYVYDGSAWEDLSDVGYYGEAYIYNNAVDTVIETANTPIALRQISSGLVNGWTFDAGSTGGITAYADGTGGTVLVSDASHGLSNGDIITIRGTTNYNGVFTVSAVTTDNFKITDTWVVNDGASDWDQGASLIAGANSAGTYTAAWQMSSAPAAAMTVTWTMYINAVPQTKTTAERKYPINDKSCCASTGVLTISTGDVVWISVQSDDTASLTNKHGNFNLHKIR